MGRAGVQGELELLPGSGSQRKSPDRTEHGLGTTYLLRVMSQDMWISKRIGQEVLKCRAGTGTSVPASRSAPESPGCYMH